MIATQGIETRFKAIFLVAATRASGFDRCARRTDDYLLPALFPFPTCKVWSLMIDARS